MAAAEDAMTPELDTRVRSVSALKWFREYLVCVLRDCGSLAGTSQIASWYQW